jgi:long-chain acyl-CoA synthetase
MDVRNLAELHRRQAERLGPRAAIRFKHLGLYRDLSWNDYLARSLACAASLVEAGIQTGDRIGLVAENRLEWLIADMGILAAGAINVPAHATLSAKQIQQQFEHAGVNFLIASTRPLWEKIRDLPKLMPVIRGVVVFDGPAVPEADSWQGFLTRGAHVLPKHEAELQARLRRVGPEDLATLMYTSGTTGNPKGVMLSHGNLLSNALSMVGSTSINADSIILSWLPFSHIYGRLVDHYETLAAGATLCLAESQETLLLNLAETQPTCFSGVPRFYEKVLAYAGPQDVPANRDKLSSLFGSRIQWLNSGGAPLPPPFAEAFVRAGLTMLQGYGLTETSPVVSFNRIEANRVGTVGQAVTDVEIRIADDGEVLTRGPHVMKGYWKDAKATAEAIRDGWFHTGDLGSLDADGYLTITGRKKDLLVLSNGKKVVPTEIEALLLQDDCIDQALVYGEGRNYLTALIVPRFDRLRSLLGVAEQDNAKLIELSAVRELMAKRFAAVLADVAEWEKVQRFALLPRPFTQEAEELTVSLKLRRGVIFQKHKEQMEALYRG